MLTFKQFINESIIDYERKSLNPALFSDVNSQNPKLKKSVSDEIIERSKLFSHISPVVSIQIIGSILTRQYHNETDIDVNLEFDDVDDETRAELIDQVRKTNGKVLPGTKHPVNFFIVTSPEQRDRALKFADAAYDVLKDRFLKKNVDDTIVNIEDYLETYKSKIYKLDLLKSELFRDIIDYETLKKLDAGTVIDFKNLINSKIKELEHGINDMIDIKDETTNERRSIFARELSKEEFNQYKVHNRLPANVVYKLLEKYHYLDLIKKLQDIIGDDRKLSKPEADKLSPIINR